MNAVIVVQARMDSSRFPGKVLAPLGDTTVLGYLLRKLKTVNLPVVVAVPFGDVNVAGEGAKYGAAYHFGSTSDVLDRITESRFGGTRFYPGRSHVWPAHVQDHSHIVRLTADNPLLPVELITEALRIAEATGADYVSNTVVRTYFDGCDVEVISREALLRADRETSDPFEREHVTPYIYRHPRTFTCRGFRNEPDESWQRRTIDTPTDLKHVAREVASRMPGFENIASLSRPEPWLRAANEDDEKLLLECRNSSPFYSSQIFPDHHHIWFAEALSNLTHGVYILEAEEHWVGYFRVRTDCGIGTVSMSLLPEYRGKGYGLIGLNLLAGRTWPQCRRLRARVPWNNEPSMRTFLKAGYEAVDEAFEAPQGRLFCLDR